MEKKSFFLNSVEVTVDIHELMKIKSFHLPQECEDGICTLTRSSLLMDDLEKGETLFLFFFLRIQVTWRNIYYLDFQRVDPAFISLSIAVTDI